MSYKCIKSVYSDIQQSLINEQPQKNDEYKKMMKTDGAWEAEVGGQPQA